MIQMLKTLCILLSFTGFLSAQSTQDSVDLNALVQKQIQKVQSEKVNPVSTTQPVENTKAQEAGSGIPENMFVLLFALAEIIAGGLIVRYYLVKKRQVVAKDTPAPKIKAEPAQRRKMTKEEFAKLRTEVTCQLTLIKTQEELNHQAKKMNVGAGELELAIRLQNMAGSN
ncbi:MAG: hypothetical protein HYV28_05665 [Ignavibacteriales bacterium]|nr:hypothetical protein [Ignavibacteriales bacterium]